MLIQVVSPPSLKLYEWQKIHRATRTLRDLLKPYPWVSGVCHSYWADPHSKGVVVRLRVDVAKGAGKAVVRSKVPQAVEGVPVVTIEED